jgi:hypothetical protein
MNRTRPTVTVLALCVLACSCARVPASPRGPRTGGPFEALGLRFEAAADYQIATHAMSRSDGVTVETYELRGSDGRVIHLERHSGVESASAETFMRDELFKIELIYEPFLDPYLGVIAQETDCPRSYRPVHEAIRRADAVLETVQLYAGERLTFGACTADAAAFRVAIGMIHCAGRGRLFVVQSFVPTALFDAADAAAIRSLSCL